MPEENDDLEIKQIQVNSNTYNIVDEGARNTLSDHEGRISALETALEGVADRLAAI